MKENIQRVYDKVNIEEGIQIIENILVAVFLHKGIATNKLASLIGLPIPIVTAIKKELSHEGLMEAGSGIRLSSEGYRYISYNLGYGTIKKELLQNILTNSECKEKMIKELISEMHDIFVGRPSVDVTVDQAKCTVRTAVKRAIVCLENQMLIGKKILCVGDDDLISIALGFLLRKLSIDRAQIKTEIVVVEKDERIIEYIEKITNQYNLPIESQGADMKAAFPASLVKRFDCVFTDPPYTKIGLELFVSRSLGALKEEKDLLIFLSFAHKSPSFQLEIQEVLTQMKLSVMEIIKNFNEYEGASILGGTSQFMILKSTGVTKPMIATNSVFEGKLYTNDYRENIRTYRCLNCSHDSNVGRAFVIKTIEELKTIGCAKCGLTKFNLLKKKRTAKKVSEQLKGQHLILDLYGCKENKLDNLKFIEKIMIRAAEEANATIVTSKFHQFNPYGISGVVVIQESHLTIHTWPEYGYAAIDIFTCGQTLDFVKAYEYLKTELASTSIKSVELARSITAI